MKNTFDHYGSVAKFFHWVIAMGLIGMFILAYIMTGMEKSDFKYSLYDIHKATGLLLFVLIALRLGWRAVNPLPAMPLMPAWQRLTAQLTIVVLYVCMFAMPITGFFMSTLGGHDVSFYGLFVIPAFMSDKAVGGWFDQAHIIISYVLIAAFVLHVLGALYHHFWLKDNVLRRMWIGS